MLNRDEYIVTEPSPRRRGEARFPPGKPLGQLIYAFLCIAANSIELQPTLEAINKTIQEASPETPAR
jgi:hypothetical protein